MRLLWKYKNLIGKQEQYLGKRFKRGLFQSATNKLINADVNGALNIMRKVVDDSVVRQIIDRGLVFRPIKINSFNKILNKKQNINTPIKNKIRRQNYEKGNLSHFGIL